MINCFVMWSYYLMTTFFVLPFWRMMFRPLRRHADTTATEVEPFHYYSCWLIRRKYMQKVWKKTLVLQKSTLILQNESRFLEIWAK